MNRLVGALAFLGVTAAASAASAQEIAISGPLANAQSCQHCVLYRAGRFTISPSFGITLTDTYDRVLFVGGALNYHFNDILAIGVWGAGGVAHIPTALTDQIQQQLSSPGVTSTYNIPDGSRFSQQVGQIGWIISAPQLTLIPLRGKLSLFQNIFIDTDFYIFAGLGIVGVTERADFDAADSNGNVRSVQSPEVQASQIARTTRAAITGTFGLGLNFYMTRFLSLSVEYRAYPFAWNTSGTDEHSQSNRCGAAGMDSCARFPDQQVERDLTAGVPPGGAGGRFLVNDFDRAFEWNHMVNFSLNFFLPLAPRISR